MVYMFVSYNHNLFGAFVTFKINSLQLESDLVSKFVNIKSTSQFMLRFNAWTQCLSLDKPSGLDAFDHFIQQCLCTHQFSATYITEYKRAVLYFG